MKRSLLFGVVAMCMASFLHGQDIAKSQVPSVILNQFEKQFPKASDVEWEKEGSMYNVDFEVGWKSEHEAWYDVSGELVKHKENLSKSKLPASIKSALQANYDGYRVDDVDRITEGKTITYKVEIEKQEADKTLFFNENGTLSNQK